MPPVSISTETAAIHSNPTRPATSPNKTCKSVSSATTKPARASHLGSTPVLNATREVTSTIADAPIWQKWYSHQHKRGVRFEDPKTLQGCREENLRRKACRLECSEQDPPGQSRGREYSSHSSSCCSPITLFGTSEQPVQHPEEQDEEEDVEKRKHTVGEDERAQPGFEVGARLLRGAWYVWGTDEVGRDHDHH
jgi:hypothetical protein